MSSELNATEIPLSCSLFPLCHCEIKHVNDEMQNISPKPSAYKTRRVIGLSNDSSSATVEGGGAVVVENDLVMIFCFSHKKRKTMETPGHCRSCCWFWAEAPYRRRPIMPALIHMHFHGRAKNTVNS